MDIPTQSRWDAILTDTEPSPDVPAFATGSRIYGTPRDGSDLDLVIRVSDPATLALIAALADPVSAEQKPSAANFGTASFRFGQLNLIVAHTDAQYATWAEGTAELLARAPVTRDEAVAVFKRLRGGGA